MWASYLNDTEPPKYHYYFYALIDPRDGLARYVGKTRQNHPKWRHNAHKNITYGKWTNQKRLLWARELAAKGFQPEMVILSETRCNAERSSELEREWVNHFLERGVGLFNGEATGAKGWANGKLCPHCGGTGMAR